MWEEELCFLFYWVLGGEYDLSWSACGSSNGDWFNGFEIVIDLLLLKFSSYSSDKQNWHFYVAGVLSERWIRLWYIYTRGYEVLGVLLRGVDTKFCG